MNKLYEYRFYEAYYFYSKKEHPTNTLCLKGYKSNGNSKQKSNSLPPLVFVDFILIFVSDKNAKTMIFTTLHHHHFNLPQVSR